MSDQAIDFTRVYAGGNSDPFQHTLGQRAQDHRGFEYMFVRAAANIGSQRALAIDHSFGASAATAANCDGTKAGVSTHEIPNGSYGWVSIFGSGGVHSGTASTGQTLYTDSTHAGEVNDSASSQIAIHNLVLRSNVTTRGIGQAIWNYPYWGS